MIKASGASLVHNKLSPTFPNTYKKKRAHLRRENMGRESQGKRNIKNMFKKNEIVMVAEVLFLFLFVLIGEMHSAKCCLSYFAKSML